MSKRPRERGRGRGMGTSCSKGFGPYKTAEAPSNTRTRDSGVVSDQPKPFSAVDNAPGAKERSHKPSDSTSSTLRPEKQFETVGSSVVSAATVENARYRLGDAPRPDHSNEDARFVINDQPRFKVMGVFDGHDGPNAVELVCNHFHQLFTKRFLHEVKEQQDVDEVLVKFFNSAESEFFKHIKEFVATKKALQSCIPEGLTSYEAYVQYPMEVAQLQELEPKIAGGTTAVIAVIYNEQLYVANTGDSRAYVIEELPNGTLGGEQLSTDHGVYNEDEVLRLQVLGLDVDQLKRSGRLGTQENTRTIGDYCIKEGYRDVDVLSNASEPPGIAIPSLNGPIAIKSSFRYLLLMSDGVYKSIEAVLKPETNENVESSKVLLQILIHYLEGTNGNVEELAGSVLDRIRRVHEDTYKKWTEEENPLAVQCRKRDDMTLVVYKFGGHVSEV